MQLPRLGFAGEIEVTSLAGSVREACLWSAGLAEPGVTRRATCSTAANRSPMPSPTTARWRRQAGGSSTPTARWFAPGWCAITARGTGCGNSTPTSPTCPATELPTGCAGFEVLERARLQRTAAAPGAFGAGRRRGRDPGPRRRTSTPTRCGPGCGCAARTGCRWSSPASAPGRQAGQRHSFAVRHGERHVRWQ